MDPPVAPRREPRRQNSHLQAAAQQQQFHEVHHNTGLQNDAESADATFS
jgi:hypothetical protein